MVVLPFRTVKARSAEPPSGTLLTLKFIAKVGGATTAMVALEVLPVPPCVAETCTELFFTPPIEPVTLSETVHVPEAASVPADKETAEDPGRATALPEQLLTKLFDVETIKPPGRVSVKARPVNATPEFGFVTVKVSEVVVVTGMEAAPNAWAIIGGLATVKLADAELPVPPLEEETAPEMLEYRPEVFPVTLTTTVHEVFVASVPPVRLRDVEPATAVAVPPQVFESPFGVAITRPVGSVSENATPASATVLPAGSVTVKVTVEVPLRAMVTGAKAWPIVGGATTLTLAEAVLPEPPSVEVMALVRLFCWPAAEPETLTVKAQEPEEAMVVGEKLMTLVACTAVTEPVQEPVSPLGEEMTSPAGRVSEKATPEREEEALLF